MSIPFHSYEFGMYLKRDWYCLRRCSRLARPSAPVVKLCFGQIESGQLIRLLTAHVVSSLLVLSTRLLSLISLAERLTHRLFLIFRVLPHWLAVKLVSVHLLVPYQVNGCDG